MVHDEQTTLPLACRCFAKHPRRCFVWQVHLPPVVFSNLECFLSMSRWKDFVWLVGIERHVTDCGSFLDGSFHDTARVFILLYVVEHLSHVAVRNVTQSH